MPPGCGGGRMSGCAARVSRNTAAADTLHSEQRGFGSRALAEGENDGGRAPGRKQAVDHRDRVGQSAERSLLAAILPGFFQLAVLSGEGMIVLQDVVRIEVIPESLPDPF